ncbi:hypothetical protein HK104_000932, partial [Borealophlyctis nickersoniae]
MSSECDPYYDYTRPTSSSYDEDLLMTRVCISNQSRTILYIANFAVAIIPVVLSLVVIGHGFATKGKKYARNPMFLIVWTTGMEMVAYCCYLITIFFAPTIRYLGKICWLFVFHFGFISTVHINLSWLNIPGPLAGPLAPKLDALRRRIYIKEVAAITVETAFTVASCALHAKGEMRTSNAMNSAGEVVEAIESSINSIPTDANLTPSTAFSASNSPTTTAGNSSHQKHQRDFMAKYAKDLRFTALRLGNLIMLSASLFFLGICIWIFASLPSATGPQYMGVVMSVLGMVSVAPGAA